jgi:hypothetical protein
VIATLDSFRKIYPTSKVHLFCDNGLDMSHIANHFNCTYQYISERTGNGDTTYFVSKEKLIAWIERLLFAAQNSSEDFILILEDDVRVFNKIGKIKFDLNCIKPNHKLGREATRFLQARGSTIPKYIHNIYYGGFGGSIINRAFIEEHFSNREKLKIALDEICPFIQRRWNGGLPQDACLTMLIIYFGGTLGLYNGFAEVRYLKYRLRPFLGKIDVLHDDKSLYNLPLSPVENKIFLGK